MPFEKPVVVIDNGSYNIKAGFACDNHPVSIFRTTVGRPSYLQGSYGKEPYDVYIGDEALERISDYDLNCPVMNGRIVHWDNMERVWHHIFYRELKVAPEDRAVILSCAVTTSIQEKIKCCEVFFETLNAPALSIQPQPVLAMYGSGCATGICIDLGYDTTKITPVYEGGLIRYAYMDTNLAGAQITDYLRESFSDRAYDFGIKTAEILEDIKKYLYVTPDCAMSRQDCKREYTLPSGETIDITQEAFMAAEMYFQPELIKKTKTYFLPLQNAVVTAALKCDAELREAMYEAVVCCGGMSMIPGLPGRLGIELGGMTQRTLNIMTSPEAYAVPWLGAATFAGLSDATQMWVHKKQYEDSGAKIIRNKFL